MKGALGFPKGDFWVEVDGIAGAVDQQASQTTHHARP